MNRTRKYTTGIFLTVTLSLLATGCPEPITLLTLSTENERAPTPSFRIVNENCSKRFCSLKRIQFSLANDPENVVWEIKRTGNRNNTVQRLTYGTVPSKHKERVAATALQPETTYSIKLWADRRVVGERETFFTITAEGGAYQSNKDGHPCNTESASPSYGYCDEEPTPMDAGLDATP